MSVGKLIIASILLISSYSFSAVAPKGLRHENRIKEVYFDPNNIIQVPTKLDMQTTIEFAPDERVTVMAFGDTSNWQVEAVDNTLFIKATSRPVNSSGTNITVKTNKRSYYLQAYLNNKNPAHVIRFLYGNTNNSYNKVEQYNQKVSKEISSRLRNNQLNCNYKTTSSKKNGDAEILSVCDDGQFTFFRFNPHKKLPVIYRVNSEGYGEMTNTRKEGENIVYEGVNNKFALLIGKEYICIEKIKPVKLKENKERRWLKK